jgi:hypothetical protein
MRMLFTAIFLSTCCSTVLAQEKPAQPDEEIINPDRPGIADGSTVVGKKRFQIETAVQKEFRSDSSSGSNEHRIFTPTLLRYGFNKQWEARVEGNGYTWARTFDPATGIDKTDGFSPISVGFKYHFQDSKGIRHPSLGTILRVFVPSGSSSFGSHRFQGDARLVADVDISDSWSLNPNVGVGLYDNGSDGVFPTGIFAITLNYTNKSKTLNPFVDLGLQAPEEENGKTSVIVDTGIAYILNRNTQLDISVGTGIAGRTPPHPFWAVGISIRH